MNMKMSNIYQCYTCKCDYNFSSSSNSLIKSSSIQPINLAISECLKLGRGKQGSGSFQSTSSNSQ